MKTDDFDQTLRNALSGTAPADVHEGAQSHFDDLAARLQSPPAHSPVRERHPLWWLWPGLGLVGAVAVMLLAASFFFTPTVSWAQVEEKFRTLRFLNMTMYVTPNAEGATEKLEIWATQDHRCRVQYRGLIIFGRDGKVVKVLRAETGEELEVEAVRAETYRVLPDKSNYPIAETALLIPEMFAKTSNFSLTELLTLFEGSRAQLQPVPNLDASLAADMPVFDFSFAHSTYWNRLWVLKKSELPIRTRGWSPETNAQNEVVFDYLAQMPDEAFDPEKVKAALLGKRGSINRLYALLKDPGQRPLTPEDAFVQTGYHLPKIESIGRTEDGVVWVISKRYQNLTPAGRLVHGWGEISDDLGQKYLEREVVGEDIDTDRYLEYYIPRDYHMAYQKPGSYTLTCVAGEEGTVVGSVPVKEWQDNTPVPPLLRNQIPGARKFTMLTLAGLCRLEDWDRFDRLAATIPGEPEEGNLPLYRDIWLAEKLDRTQQPKEALVLRARLYPLLKPLARDGSQARCMAMTGYVAGLWREGKRDEARKVANERVTAVTNAKEYSHVYCLLLALHEAGMSELEARQFFDTDVFQTPLVKEELERKNFFRDGRSDGPAQPPSGR